MGKAIKVISSIFKKLYGSPGNSVIVTGTGEGGKPDEVELYQHPGILSRPDGNEICAIIEIGDQRVIVGTQNYSVEKSIDKGELFIYSVVDGVVKSSILLNRDGELIVNEGTDFAVRFSELKAGYDELKTDFNNLVTKYNAHIHVTTATIGASATPGTIAPTTSSGTSSTASIDDSKVDKVKLP